MRPTQRLRAWLLVLFLAPLLPAPVLALDIRNLQVTRDGASYHVNFDVLIPVAPAEVEALLRDYRQWPRLSDTLTESELLLTLPDGRQRVRVVFNSCVLIFCKTIAQTKDMDSRKHGDIRAVILPTQSDFSAGWEHWQIRPTKNMTQVQYRAEFAPSFSLPPVIGPWILKARLRQKLTLTAKRLEILSRDATK